MGLRQERVDLVSLPIECERVCAYFRGHHLLAAHCFNVNDVYYSWVSDRHIKLVGWRVQKYYVRCPAETNSIRAGAGKQSQRLHHEREPETFVATERQQVRGRRSCQVS